MSNSIALTESRGVHMGVPTYFSALCYEATQGGYSGYYSPGYTLASAVGSEQPYGLDMDEWGGEIDSLRWLLSQDDTEGTWQCFARHYPRMMALVPRRRREQFICGVRAAYEDGRVAL